MRVACVLVTHMRAKLEMQKQPHLKDRPALVVDRSRGRPLVVDHFPAAAGVAAGMTLEQALSRNADSPVLEADEAAYRRVFHRVLLSLQEVSDRVEGGDWAQPTCASTGWKPCTAARTGWWPPC